MIILVGILTSTFFVGFISALVGIWYARKQMEEQEDK